MLQGSKVILDVEEEGIDKRTILSLDAATEISSSGITCFRSSDGKEHCFADAKPGECSSFGGPDERRQLFFKKMKRAVVNTVNSAKQAAEKLLADTTATVNKLAEEGKKYVVTNGDIIKATSMINSMTAIELGPVYQASVDRTNNAMKQANVASAALAGIEAGSKIAAKGMMTGAYEVAQAGVWLAEWIDAMQCEIGMNLLLGALFALKLVDPLPVGVATATAYLTGAAIAYKAAPFSTEKAVLGGACDLAAEHFLENIWSSTSVVSAVGEHNKEVLLDAIAMTVCKTLKSRVPDAFVSGFSGAAIVAGVTINSATELACRKRVPRGTAVWGESKVYVLGFRYENAHRYNFGAYSWESAESVCSLKAGRTLCPRYVHSLVVLLFYHVAKLTLYYSISAARSVYCPNGPLQPPDGGMRNFNSWAPIGGEGVNKWINIGNQNPTTELCKDHYELGYGNPEWGLHGYQQLPSGAWSGSDFKRSIYCCWGSDVPTFEDPPPNTPTIAPTTSTPTNKWHFAPVGHAKCDYGSSAPQNECEAAVKSLGGTGSLVVGSNSGSCKASGWNAIPLGCSAQTGGSWVAHFKTKGGNCNEGRKYQLVCG